MKILLLTCMVILSSLSSLYSQTIKGEFFLSNGTILKGTLLQNDSTVVKIKLRDGNIWAFNPKEIERMVVVGTHKPNEEKNIKTSFSLSAGSLIGSSVNEKQTPLSLTLELQSKIYKSASIGLSTGLEFLNESVIPLGLTLKGYYHLTNQSELYAGITGGYLISLEKPFDPYNYDYIDEHNGGTYVNAELGAIFTSNSRTRFFIATGYRYAELHYSYSENYWLPDKLDMYFNRMNLRFGFWFE